MSRVGVAKLAGGRGPLDNGACCASKAGLIVCLQGLRAELRAGATPIPVLKIPTAPPAARHTAHKTGD